MLYFIVRAYIAYMLISKDFPKGKPGDRKIIIHKGRYFMGSP